jgi:hypothetical protein
MNGNDLGQTRIVSVGGTYVHVEKSASPGRSRIATHVLLRTTSRLRSRYFMPTLGTSRLQALSK